MNEEAPKPKLFIEDTQKLDMDHAFEDLANSAADGGEGMSIGSVVNFEGKQWAIAAAKQNKRTGAMEYLISDATTKEDGLSSQRFVAEADLTAGSVDGAGDVGGEQTSPEDDTNPEDSDEAAGRGRQIAQLLLDRGLIGQNEFDSVANSHAERIRGQREEEVTPLQNENDPEGGVVPLQNENGPEGGVVPLQNENDSEGVVALQNENSLDQERAATEAALELARNEYAKETARDRKRSWGRLLESDNKYFSRLIKKIPGAVRAAEFINENFTSHDDMDAARSTYEGLLRQSLEAASVASRDSLNEAKEREIAELAENSQDKTQEEIRALISEIERRYEADIRASEIMLSTAEDAKLEADIVRESIAQSKKAGKFSNWWARQSGFTGGLKKAGVVLGAGFVAGAAVSVGGLAIGIGVPAAAASMTGGAVGYGIGFRLKNRLASAFVDKEKTKTVAQQRSERDLDAKNKALKRSVDDEHWSARVNGEDSRPSISQIGTSNIIGGTEKSTAEVVKGNRNRIKTLMALGALGGRLGAMTVDAINQSISSVEAQPDETSGGETSDNGSDNNPEDNSGGDSGDNSGGDSSDNHGHGQGEVGGDRGPVAPAEDPGLTNPETRIEGLNFNVESGNGLTNELQEFAQVNGKSLSGDQAWSLHNDIMKQFGQDYIDINGPGADIYVQSGDVRLMEPGAATWKDGVPEFIMEWMNQRGL